MNLFTPKENFASEKAIELTGNVSVIAARLYTVRGGDVRLDMVCLGDTEAVVREAIVAAKVNLGVSTFGIVLPAEDIFEIEQHCGGLFVVTLG